MTNDAAKKLGSLGGKATLEKHGKDHFKKISRIGLERRWGGKKNQGNQGETGEYHQETRESGGDEQD